ncbi:MAG: leucine-rich repeat domain-containing protein [Planctomycetota bacterium]|jgi:Leucine-rich repeat (LRR) protein
MKRIVFPFLVLMALIPSLAKAQEPVYFDDANLKAAVQEAIGITGDPTESDMLSLTALSARNMGITSLIGLENAENLISLSPRENQIQDVSPIAGLTKLKTLWLHDNQISDVSPLSGLTSLWRLVLINNNVSDLSPLAGLVTLERLGFGNNQVEDISPLVDLTELWRLTFTNNAVTDISPLAGLTNLGELRLSNNPVQDFGVLSELTNLTQLLMAGCGIEEIDCLAPLVKMDDLNLANNDIGEISALAGMSALSQLNLYGNRVSDISALVGLTNLTWLDLRGNALDTTAYTIHIPQILENNPGIELLYDEPSWQRTLTINSSEGGTVVIPGEGQFQYDEGAVVSIAAVWLDQFHRFEVWTGSAVNNGKVADPTSLATTVTVDGDYSLVANFKRLGEPWQVVYSDDFEGQVGPEWSRPDRDVTPIGERGFLGQFGNDTVTLTMQDLLAHGYVKLSFDLFIIRTWDGESRQSPPDLPTGPGPDIWSLTTDNGPPLLYATFDNHHMEPYKDWHRQSYPQEHTKGDMLPQTGAVEKNTLGYQHYFATEQLHNADSVYQLTFTIPHAASRLDIDFAAFGLQPLADESWGLDNVRVEVAGPDVELPVSFRDPQLKACIEAHLGITDPAPTDMLELRELICTEGDIFDLTGLEYAINLIYIDLRDNQITDISPLQALTQLNTLDLRGNPLNTDAYKIYIPQILANNYGIEILYDTPLMAWNPIPGNGTKVFEPNTVLSWTAGSKAASHNVYFGTDQNDVAAGMTSTFMGNQPATTYDPSFLEENTTYYWRIDEINDLHPDSPWTGTVWSFTYALGSPINQPEMGTSLGEIGLDDPVVFDEQVQKNNFQDSQNPEFDRLHIEQVKDLEPNPAGMMRMQNLEDLDPASPTYSEMVPARAKGVFNESSAQRVLVRFSYLFERSTPGLELVAYLSDVPELLDSDDPLRAEHYVEIGRIPMPPAGLPGSFGSGRFGIFEQLVYTGSLDLSNGTWVELELVEQQPYVGHLFSFSGGIRLASSESSGGAALIGDWAVEVHCDGICMDLNWSDAPDEEDFMLVLASCGESAGLLEGGVGSRVCLDGAFSTDGFVDTFDIASWDWALRDPERVSRLNMCGVPFSEEVGTTSSAVSSSFESSAVLLSIAGLESLSDILIVGKRSTSEDPTALKSRDRIYSFESNGQYVEYFDPKSDHCNIKLVKGPEGQLYQVNIEEGVSKLDDDKVVIPPGEVEIIAIKEPRHNKSATVYIGIQDEGPDSFGRPILDAAFDDDYAYVVPVVVEPDGQEAYAAAAKLQLLDSGNPPYEVVQLYDDPPPAADNQSRNNLREIEIDSAGNVYVVNVHSLNESDILWKYASDGTMLKRLDLCNPDSEIYIPDPIAMHMSDNTDMLYLTSAQYNQTDVNSTVVYGFSTEEALTLKRSITIDNMQHVTGITEDAATGSLWAAGFNMENIPDSPNPTKPPFYYPILAKIPYGDNDAQLTALLGLYDLGLPMSIVWTATADKCGGADLNESGNVNFTDFAILAQYWLDSNCNQSEWCAGADFNKNTEVDFVDLTIMVEYWLKADCDNP